MSNQFNKKKVDYNYFTYIAPEETIRQLKILAFNNDCFKKQDIAFLKYLYVVNTISRHYISNCLNKKNNHYKGCTLNISSLTRILGVKNSITCKIIQDLIEYKIIKRIGGYIKNCQSFRYGLFENQVDIFESIAFYPKTDKISNKIIRKHNDYFKIEDDNLNLYKSYLDRLSIDGLEDYLIKINKDLGIKGESLSIYLMMGEFNITDSNFGITISNINLVLESLIAIQNGGSHVRRKRKESRVYTYLTNLKREARELLLYEGEKFIEFDIRNSQPLLASIMIKQWWIQKNKDNPDDVKQYVKDCESGSFYDYFMILNNISEEMRSQFKVDFFAEVFFSKVTKRETKLKKQFRQKYPSCYQAICDIKGGLGSEGYNEFSILLQKQEAQIIFDNVNIRLLKEGIPAFNIFDSILCLPKDAEYVKECIFDAFRPLNITPTLNIKDYTKRTSVAEVFQLIERNKLIQDKQLIHYTQAA